MAKTTTSDMIRSLLRTNVFRSVRCARAPAPMIIAADPTAHRVERLLFFIHGFIPIEFELAARRPRPRLAGS